MVEPRILIVSRDMGSRPFCVIFTARRAVFIWGETEVIVPCRMVPRETAMSHCQIAGRAWDRQGAVAGIDIPFFSSMVTVSLAHFIKNLRIAH